MPETAAMDHEQKEQCNFFEVALFFLFLQISRECVTMEARTDPDGVRGNVRRYDEGEMRPE